jgi:hypothetical protein
MSTLRVQQHYALDSQGRATVAFHSFVLMCY